MQAVLGRVDAHDSLLDPITVPMTYAGAGEGGTDTFSATTPLPVAGPVGYTVRVLPHHALLAGDNELGLVTLA
uniref:CAZy families GT35 protein n=1 Tax=uncultured Mycobacterium sp. TaxID=171292 RepID=A0A060C592_9MYCO|nr:CAZy families GT35 protein [uncultured Mycobacterium sp.]